MADFSTQKKTVMEVWATKIPYKTKGPNDLVHFSENCKKVKIEDQKKENFWTFSAKFTKNDVFAACDFIFDFFELHLDDVLLVVGLKLLFLQNL